jgi:hypothetical protein
MGAADKAFFHVMGNHGVIRDFFGLSDEDEERIVQILDTDTGARIARL